MRIFFYYSIIYSQILFVKTCNFGISNKNFPDTSFSTIKANIKKEPGQADEHVIELKFRVKLPDSAIDRERVKRHILENGILILRRIDQH